MATDLEITSEDISGFRALTFSTATEEFLTAAKRTEYSQF